MAGKVFLAMLACACSGREPPTFSDDVATILYGRCAPCHRPGESAPFPLLGYDDAHRKRQQIARVVREHRMPPWLPVEGDFLDDRRLQQEQVETICRWVEAGAPRGDAAREPQVPQFREGWQLREPDLVVTAPAALTVPAAGANALRNLVLPVPIDRLRYVKAVEIRPGSAAVHHAVLCVDGTRESRRLDALDPEPGFAGMTMGMARAPDGHFLGWTPGKQTSEARPGMAFRLWPGQDLVLQLHLVPTGKAESVRPRIGFYFTDVPPTVRFELLVLWSEQIDIAPGTADYVVRDELTLPVAASVHAIYPHAHYLCRRMKGTAVLPDGSERTLFRIDEWDFNWQGEYRFRQPVALPAGSKVALEYRYDNSAGNPKNPHQPPRRVRFGQESSDEMATLTMMVVLERPAERGALIEAVARRELAKRNQDHAMWVRLAAALRGNGKPEEGLEAAERALQILPAHAEALCERGLCLEVLGRVADAERSYREAIAADPEQSVARGQLGAILGRAGRAVEALEQLGKAVEVHPDNPLLLNNLATALFADGRLGPAAKYYRRALALDPDYFNAWFNLGRVLAGQGEKDAARQALQRAVALRPGDAAAAQALRELGR